MSMTPEEIMQACCADPKNKSRYAMEKPWISRGYEYATDGRIMARRLSEAVSSQGTFPDAHGLKMWSSEVEKFIDLPSFAEIKGCEECEQCEGTGCEKDENATTCQDCDGTGKLKIDKPVKICINPEIYIAPRYAKKIEAMGVVACELIRYHMPCIRFTIGEIQIVLMGVGNR